MANDDQPDIDAILDAIESRTAEVASHLDMMIIATQSRLDRLTSLRSALVRAQSPRHRAPFRPARNKSHLLTSRILAAMAAHPNGLTYRQLASIADSPIETLRTYVPKMPEIISRRLDRSNTVTLFLRPSSDPSAPTTGDQALPSDQTSRSGPA